MVLGIKFLAVLDDNFFHNNLYATAKAIDGIADVIWYRVKKNSNINSSKIYNIRKIVNKSMLVLSNYYDIAIKYGYDGIHLNKENIKKYNIIKSTTNLIVGYSSHSSLEIDTISADYYTLSPIYNTPKEYQITPLGIIKYNKSKKVFALGGISFENLNTIKDNFYGFAGIRVIDEIIKSNF